VTFGLLFNVNFRFYLRTRRFQVFLPFIALLSILEPILIVAGVVPKPADVYGFTADVLGVVNTAVLLTAAVLAGDAISRDFSRQGYFTLTQPVRRSVLMAARFSSAFCATAIIMLVAAALQIGLSEYLYGQLVPTIGLILLFVILLSAAMTMFILMFSSIFKSQALSIVVAVLIVLLAMPVIQDVLQFVNHAEPWFLITYAAGVISNLAMKTYPPHLTSILIGSGRMIQLYTPTELEGFLIMMGYLVVSAVIAWLIYSRRELKD
jgi:ABC-2 type transport system permease protein